LKPVQGFDLLSAKLVVAFTPKGGCPLKRKVKVHVYLLVSGSVAFTPKGGCPLKHRLVDRPADRLVE